MANHSAIFNEYFQKLSELEQISIITTILEKYAVTIGQSKPVVMSLPDDRLQSVEEKPKRAYKRSKRQLAKAEVKAEAKEEKMKARVQARAKEKAKVTSINSVKKKRPGTRFGEIAINGVKYRSPGEAFNMLGLVGSKWYIKIRGKNTAQIEKLLTEELAKMGNDVNTTKKVKVIRRPKMMA